MQYPTLLPVHLSGHIFGLNGGARSLQFTSNVSYFFHTAAENTCQNYDTK